MKLQLVLDSLVFSTLYSQIPFFCTDFFETTRELLLFSYDSYQRKQSRHITVFIVSFFLFHWFHYSGLRNRYMIYHLEKNRHRSGLYPFEMFVTALYFCSFYFPLEYTTAYFDNNYPSADNSVWPLHMFNKISNTFLIASLYHYALESSGFMDNYRLNYFTLDRD